MGDGGLTPRVLIAAAVLACTMQLACSAPCLMPPCPLSVPLILQIRDATDGGLVEGVAVNGVSCAGNASCIVTGPDHVIPPAPGLVTAEVTAPGYRTQSLAVDVPAAAVEECSCRPDYVPQTRDVALLRL